MCHIWRRGIFIDSMVKYFTSSLLQAASSNIPQLSTRHHVCIPFWMDECWDATHAWKRAFQHFQIHPMLDRLISFKHLYAKVQYIAHKLSTHHVRHLSSVFPSLHTSFFSYMQFWQLWFFRVIQDSKIKTLRIYFATWGTKACNATIRVDELHRVLECCHNISPGLDSIHNQMLRLSTCWQGISTVHVQAWEATVIRILKPSRAHSLAMHQ